MRTFLITIFLPMTLIAGMYAQAPGIEWQKSLGGSSHDNALTVHNTSDGGYVLAGLSLSNNGDVSGNHGGYDFWLVKITADGTIQWQKSLGGSFDEIPYDMQNTSDGGFIIAGSSFSNNGDVTGNHGFKDGWVVKLNSSGDIQWQKSLGGSDDDEIMSIRRTNDGNFIVAGATRSNDGDVAGNHGGWDYWVVKLSFNGTLQWQKPLGGTNDDRANSVYNTSDDGYIVAGKSASNNGSVSGNHGSSDFWVIKLNSFGQTQWQKSLGGTQYDEAESILQTADGGYIVVGTSESNDGDVSGGHGDLDYWIVKLDATGNIQWQKAYGGSSADAATSVYITEDPGYLVAGFAGSNDGDVIGNHGNSDIWVLKLGPDGTIQWQKSLGGTQSEIAHEIRTTLDGGYIIAGGTWSSNGDVTDQNGDGDCWIVKLSSAALINDNACSAVLVPADGTVQDGFSNVGATVASGEDAIVPPNIDNNCVISWCDTAITNSVWFSFVAPSTGAVEVSTCDMASFDTQIAVYSVGDCSDFGSYNLLQANDDGIGCPDFSSKMDVYDLTPGQTYYIIVDGYNGEVGGFSIQVSPITASATHELFANSPLLAVYPNPSSGQLTISLDEHLLMDGYSFMDLTGKVIMDVRLELALGQTEVDLNMLPKGLYLLQVHAGDKVFSEKIIVQ